jgi:hypothetical protein
MVIFRKNPPLKGPLNYIFLHHQGAYPPWRESQQSCQRYVQSEAELFDSQILVSSTIFLFLLKKYVPLQTKDIIIPMNL